MSAAGQIPVVEILPLIFVYFTVWKLQEDTAVMDAGTETDVKVGGKS